MFRINILEYDKGSPVLERNTWIKSGFETKSSEKYLTIRRMK